MMSRMIPPTISPEVKSPAERRIYEWLSRMNWGNSVVLHSLGVAHHTDKIFGEIDFVVISNEGVLCIEVKGGRVKRENGLWTYTDRYGNKGVKHEGPFEQAQGNMHSLRKYLRKRIKNSGDNILKCQFACGVMIPDDKIDVSGPDGIEEVLFDISNSEKDLIGYIKQSYSYWRNLCMELHGFQGGKLSDSDIQRMIDLLRGDFNFVPPLTAVFDRVEETLLSLTEEQYEVLQEISDNPRLLVSGAAGTGKTLLAMEQCRRANAEGKRVLYLCYNNLIASYVRDSLDREVDVFTFHSFLINACKITFHSSDIDFFTFTIPQLFLQQVENGAWKEESRYDLVVIDEGQDLMKTNYYLCINELITGGITSGSWTMYFDPNQNIFGTLEEFEEIKIELKRYSYTRNLTHNCRNTRQIADGNLIITNIAQANIIRTGGYEVEYFGYTSLQDEKKKLISCIRNLKSQGVSLNDIVILSPYLNSNTNCCLAMGDIPEDISQMLVNPKSYQRLNNNLQFYTIYTFKGLESKVVIMIDMDEFIDPARRLLNYVGISRARTMLYIFYDLEAEEQRQKMLVSATLNK